MVMAVIVVVVVSTFSFQPEMSKYHCLITIILTIIAFILFDVTMLMNIAITSTTTTSITIIIHLIA